MTSTGLVVAPLALLIIMLPWRFSIGALLVFATMDSSAVVNAGSFGLQPGYFFGLLMIARTAVEILLLRIPLNAHVVRLLIPLVLFAIICCVSIWIGLTFFQGKIMVIGGEAGFNLDLAQPYTFQRQNLTQPFYLLLNLGIVYALAHQITRLPADRVAAVLDRAVLGAILFASLIGFWEMASFYAHLPFIPDFFHNNAGYAHAYGQVLSGGILRVSGPFSEPSALAYHFSAFLLYAWYRYWRSSSASTMILVLLCLTLMVLSTSTSAFAVLAIFSLIVAKDIIVALARSQVGFSMNHFGVAAILGPVAIGVYVFVQSNWYEINTVITSMLIEKHHSSSFAERSGADLMAIDIVLQTGGIGIGLGSHKPNNLVMTLLSNTGIAGSLMFGLFLLELLRPRRMPTLHVDVRPFRWLIIGLMLVHAFSNPNLSPIILWIGFGLIIGALATEREALGALDVERRSSLPSVWPRPPLPWRPAGLLDIANEGRRP